MRQPKDPTAPTQKACVHMARAKAYLRNTAATLSSLPLSNSIVRDAEILEKTMAALRCLDLELTFAQHQLENKATRAGGPLP